MAILKESTSSNSGGCMGTPPASRPPTLERVIAGLLASDTNVGQLRLLVHTTVGLLPLVIAEEGGAASLVELPLRGRVLSLLHYLKRKKFLPFLPPISSSSPSWAWSSFIFAPWAWPIFVLHFLASEEAEAAIRSKNRAIHHAPDLGYRHPAAAPSCHGAPPPSGPKPLFRRLGPTIVASRAAVQATARPRTDEQQGRSHLQCCRYRRRGGEPTPTLMTAEAGEALAQEEDPAPRAGAGASSDTGAAAAASQEWLVVPPAGESRAGEFGRHRIMEMTGLPTRDLHVLDPLLSIALARHLFDGMGKTVADSGRNRFGDLTDDLLWHVTSFLPGDDALPADLPA
ncbi:hypothetical protein QYE76_026808 [Lolium multiflorum]|uniref:Uncharacterized protein n=1 Tax=Lolium multiflorum TaxID=4521 RepID=A0AAD8VXA0_LOLMU|nr:hypothetical protein QYE76_026808 [Lolium multiflorum]